MEGRDMDRAARSAAVRRRNPDPEIREERNRYLAEQSGWSGACHFCKKKLTGTMAELADHLCPQYEAQRAKSN